MTFLVNWKTTLAGAAVVLGALAHLLNAVAAGDTSTLAHDLTIITGGIGLLFAKDGASKAS